MSLQLFNIFLDRVLRQENESAMAMGLKHKYENVGGSEIKHVLYPDDTVFIEESRDYLQHIVDQFEGV